MLNVRVRGLLPSFVRAAVRGKIRRRNDRCVDVS
jgi:hypothetical protein